MDLKGFAGTGFTEMTDGKQWLAYDLCSQVRKTSSKKPELSNQKWAVRIAKKQAFRIHCDKQ